MKIKTESLNKDLEKLLKLVIPENPWDKYENKLSGKS